MTTVDDVTAAVTSYGDGRYTNGKAEQAAADQVVLDALQGRYDALQVKYDQLWADTHPSRFPGDPGVGNMYVGASVLHGDLTPWEGLWGHKAGVARTYQEPPGNPAASIARCKADTTAARLPWHSTKLPGTWAEMAAGKHDTDFLIPLLVGLGALGAAIWLTLHHEPIDNAGPAGSGMTSADYRAMYDHADALLAQLGITNVVMVPVIQAFPIDPQALPPGTVNPADWFYAGAKILGLDNYNHASFDPVNHKKWRTAEQVLAVVDLVQKAFPGKPVAVAEYGVRTDPSKPGAAGQWIADFDAGARRRGVVATAYFNQGQNVQDGGSPWTLNDKAGPTDGIERMAAFALVVSGSAHP